MKNGVVLLILLISLTFLIGCASDAMVESRLEQLDKSTDRVYEREQFEALMELIKGKDREGIKEMFSENALEETENLDEGINFLFEIVQGELEFYDDGGGPDVSELNEYGDKSIQLRSWIDFETTEENYRIFIIDYRVDMINPQNEGIYALRICRKEEVEEQFSSWQDMAIPGIYMPEE
jgi:hypothetical protein